MQDMFQARVVSGGETADKQKTATIGWPDDTPLTVGAIVIVMTPKRFDAVTQTAKSLGKIER